MLEDIADELRTLAKTSPDFEPRPLSDPDNRWIVRSAIQKAIRRGEAERALRMGEYLYDADQVQFWSSLATIIVEDVGIGDLDLLTYSTLTTLKSLRMKTDPVRLAGAMIARACEGPKSRSCCELSLGADKGATAKFEAYKPLSETELHALMKSDSMEDAYVAGVVLRQQLRGQGTDALMPTLQLIMEALDDPTEQRAAMSSFERTVDSMNIALFPILAHFNKVEEAIDEVDERPAWPPEEIIKSVSSSAFDMHTMQGKKAIRAFWKHLCKDHAWATQLTGDDAIRAIGSLVFIVEGGMVDRRLTSPMLADLKVYQDTNFAKGYGMPAELVDDNFEQVLQDVRDGIPKLNELRKWAVG